MMPILRRLVQRSTLAGAVLVVTAGAANAQLGKPTGPPTWAAAPGTQEPVVDEKHMRRFDATLDGLETTIGRVEAGRDTNEHAILMGSMVAMLEQLRASHRHLRAMLTDPAIASDRKKTLVISRVYHDLEGMASALRAMAVSSRSMTSTPPGL